jgi:hypothetical protein
VLRTTDRVLLVIISFVNIIVLFFSDKYKFCVMVKSVW